MKILLAGYNGWSNIELIKETILNYLPLEPTICYYSTPFGALVNKVCKDLSIKHELINEGSIENINLLLAFHPYIRKSKSTKELIRKCSSANIPYNTFGSHF